FDTNTSPKTAIVNRAFARKFLNGDSPLGKTFHIDVGLGVTDHSYQIVGMVEDTKYRNLREQIDAQAYFPAAQEERPNSGTGLVLRSSLPIGAITSATRQELMSFNPNLNFSFRVFETQIKQSIQRERLLAVLSGFFGILAALLTTIGLYGVLSYSVSKRTPEIGVRMALGADKRHIIFMVLRETLWLLLGGLVVGTGTAILVNRYAETLLYDIKPTDVTTFLGAIVLLVTVAIVASYIPARRASHLNPMAALRDE